MRLVGWGTEGAEGRRSHTYMHSQIVKYMITLKDLNDIAENKIKNEAQKAIIRSSFPPHIAERMCAAIDGQEKLEHLIRFLNEYKELMVQQQMQQAAVVEFLRGYKR